jgi:hypothetical protein
VNYTPKVSGSHTVAVLMATKLEVQTVLTAFSSAGGRGGTFTLAYGANVTDPLAWDTPAAEMNLALERLGNTGSLLVARTPVGHGYSYAVTFTSKVGDALPLVTAGGSLIGAGATVTVTETVKGTRAHIKTGSTSVHTGAPGPLLSEVQVVKVAFGSATGRGGTFMLTFNRFVTAPLAWSATAADVKSALEALSVVGPVTVTRSAAVNNGYEWTITFSAVDAQGSVIFTQNIGNLPNLGINGALLTGTAPVASLAASGARDGMSPFVAVVDPAGISAAHTSATDSVLGSCGGHCTAPGGALSTGTSQSTAQFTIQTRDEFSNAIPRGPLKEVQLIETTANASLGGTFSLSFRGASTPPLAVAATVSDVQGALEKLTSVGAVSVTATNLTNGFRYAVTFDSNLGDLPAMTADGTKLTGTGPTAAVVSCDKYMRQEVSTTAHSGAVIGGSFRLVYQGYSTGDLAWNVDPAAMRAALEQLSPLYSVTVTRGVAGSGGGYRWVVQLNSIEGAAAPLFAEGHLLYSNISSLITPAGVQVNSVHCAAGTIAGAVGDNFVVRLLGPTSSRGVVQYMDSGRYLVQYTVPPAGTYSMEVSKAHGGGLTGSYYNNRWLYHEPTLTRVDEVVNFYWDSFITPTGKDYISVRWVGFVQPAFSEKYTFTVHVNDGAKLWVNGEVLIDHFETAVDKAGYESPPGTFQEYSGTTTATLTGGMLYDIKLEFRENTGSATARLFWSSFTQQQSIVPSNRLFHSDTPVLASPYAVVPVGVKPTPPTAAKLAIASETSLTVTFLPPLNDGGDAVTKYKVEWYQLAGGQENQTLKITGATSGDFTLTFGAKMTYPISSNSSALLVEKALEALDGVGDVIVTCDGVYFTNGVYDKPCASQVWHILFKSALGNVANLVVNGAGLSGGEAAVCADGSVGQAAGTSIACFNSDSAAGTAYTAHCSTLSGGCGEVSGSGLDVPVGTPYSYVIQGLPQGMTQFVRVSAYNNLGFGSPSNPITLAPMSPPLQPGEVRVLLVAGASDKLRVHWTTPTDHHGSPVTKFKVEWSPSASFESTSVVTYENTPGNLNGPENRPGYVYLITGLTAGTPYFIRVSAFNVMGYGPEKLSAPLSEIPRKAPDLIPYGGVSLAVVPADNTGTVRDSVQSLLVSWQASPNAQGASVTEYSVEWWSAAGRTEVQQIQVSGSAALTGTFKVSFGGQSTDDLLHSISAADMTIALEGLASIRTAEVSRAAVTNGFVWTVALTSDAGDSPNTFAVDGADLACGTCTTIAVGRAGLITTLSGTAAVTDGSTSVTTSAGWGASGIVAGSWVQINSQVFSVAAISGTSVTLSSPYLGANDAAATAFTGTNVPGSLPTGYGQHSVTDLSGGEPFGYTITGLTSGLPYFVRVTPKNNLGFGVPQTSLPVSLAPPKQKPDVPLRSEVVVHSATSLKVLWHAPDSNGGDAITKYRVEWDTKSTFDSGTDGAVLGWHELPPDSGSCAPTPCSYTPASLTKGTPYFARVYAYNSFGFSTRAALTTPLSEAPMTVPAPPPLVSITPAAAGLTVSFPPSADSGGKAVTKYQVEWDTMGQTAHLASATANSVLYSRHEVQTITTGAIVNDLGGVFHRQGGRGRGYCRLVCHPVCGRVEGSLGEATNIGCRCCGASASGSYVSVQRTPMDHHLLGEPRRRSSVEGVHGQGRLCLLCLWGPAHGQYNHHSSGNDCGRLGRLRAADHHHFRRCLGSDGDIYCYFRRPDHPTSSV